jgi:methylamine methyltransferase corrinoid protein reductive activase
LVGQTPITEISEDLKMATTGIALDLGTSGFRGQALDLDQNAIILATVVTTRHPLPGANVMDHLHFAIEIGQECAQEVVVGAVNYLIENLGIDKSDVARLAVCGNPIQLSLFQGIEIRDLAYAGKRKLEALGVVPPKRDAQIIKAKEIQGLDLPPHTDILIPPAVRHEVGADALAMMIQTGMLERDEIAIVTDYGTNAEMALVVNGTVYTGSTAAGPALEGQQIEDGLLALPGAICDVEFESAETEEPDGVATQRDDQSPAETIKTYVLDGDMDARPGDTVDCTTGNVLAKGEAAAVGITGTGVVAVISQGLRAGLIRIPRIRTPDAKIHLPDGIRFTEKDLTEAGKAIGAVRAGHISLCQEAGIKLEDIETAYMSGASGTYVDALKAREIGMIPAGVKKIYQVGNTSLAMARDLVRDVDALRQMKQIADDLRQHHCMFATSKVFEKVFILELSYWTEGLPLNQYQTFLKKFGLPPLNAVTGTPKVIKTVEKDIPELGVAGLKIISDIGQRKSIVFEGCTGCSDCVEECPEQALHIKERQEDFEITVDFSLCDGLACRKCEKVCQENVFNQKRLFTSENTSSPVIKVRCHGSN